VDEVDMTESAEIQRNPLEFKGLRNLFALYMPLAHYCALFDNSSAAPVLVYEREGAAERVVQPATYARIRKQAGEAA
jgi:predicted ABC-type ATPase